MLGSFYRQHGKTNIYIKHISKMVTPNNIFTSHKLPHAAYMDNVTDKGVGLFTHLTVKCFLSHSIPLFSKAGTFLQKVNTLLGCKYLLKN